MPTYVVTCASPDPDAIERMAKKANETFTDFCRPVPNTWIISTGLPAVRLRNGFKQELGAGAAVLVATLHGPIMGHGMPKDVREWVARRESAPKT